MVLLRCVIYFALIGAGSFLVGRLLPKSWFHSERFPYCSFAFEHDGKIYNRLKIKAWQNRVPDMSRILPGTLPAKRMESSDPEVLTRMLQETCVAELIHVLLGIAGFGCLSIWKGAGGWVISIAYLLGNLPFVLIQRYNRPRLQRLVEKARRVQTACAARAEKPQEVLACEY